MKFISIILFSLFPLLLISQKNKVSIELNQHLKKVDKDEKVPLLVESTYDISEWIAQHQGKLRMKVGPYYSMELPAKSLMDFSTNKHIKRIEFSTAAAFALNDSMRANNNIDSLIYFPKNFPSSHSGKNVIMGVIDSGIDFSHRDFKDSSGNTRILYIWDQAATTSPIASPQPYAYGIEWDSSDINNGNCSHQDPLNNYGHGTMVAGAAAGNGLASGNYKGVAYNSDIIVVATDFNKSNWLQTVAEGVDYIFRKADQLNRACVINISAGTYAGSHDGLDIAAQIIDTLIKSKNGRTVVAAAGNAGQVAFHLGYDLKSDTNFTWFEYSQNLFGVGGIYFKLYADTADFNNVQFSISADKTSNAYSRRAYSPYAYIQSRLYQLTIDSLKNNTGQLLAVVQSYAEENNGVYSLEIAILDPDSSQYSFALNTTGKGRFDLWSSPTLTGSSNMYSKKLPSSTEFPLISQYKQADSLQSMVSSFTCLPSVLTVGNYTNRNSYLAANNQLQTFNNTVGDISPQSSLGPNRLGYPKPDIAAAGDIMISSGSKNVIQQLLQSEAEKISADSLHMRNGGTSMAAPGTAGILALYLEKCPKANYKEIIDALIQNAKKDSFTNLSYSPKWGYGKVDAYNALQNSNFETGIQSSMQKACEGDSIELTSIHTHHSYYWSNADSSKNTFVTEKGKYALMATNTSYCRSLSDSMELYFLDAPPKPIIVERMDTLFSSGDGTFQWFFNGKAIQGANDSMLFRNSSGDYQVALTDTMNGCSSISDKHYSLVTYLEKNEEKSICSIFPNPSKGVFQIKCPNMKSFQLAVYDTKGKMIHSDKKGKHHSDFAINLEGYNKGMYLLVLQTENNIYFQKLFLQ